MMTRRDEGNMVFLSHGAQTPPPSSTPTAPPKWRFPLGKILIFFMGFIVGGVISGYLVASYFNPFMSLDIRYVLQGGDPEFQASVAETVAAYCAAVQSRQIERSNMNLMLLRVLPMRNKIRWDLLPQNLRTQANLIISGQGEAGCAMRQRR